MWPGAVHEFNRALVADRGVRSFFVVVSTPSLAFRRASSRETGTPGETYNVGGNAEKKNIEVVTAICSILDRLRPKAEGQYADQITYVTNRPGHDHRYAIDASRIRSGLDWTPSVTFEQGIEQTVA